MDAGNFDLQILNGLQMLPLAGKSMKAFRQNACEDRNRFTPGSARSLSAWLLAGAALLLPFVPDAGRANPYPVANPQPDPNPGLQQPQQQELQPTVPQVQQQQQQQPPPPEGPQPPDTSRGQLGLTADPPFDPERLESMLREAREGGEDSSFDELISGAGEDDPRLLLLLSYLQNDSQRIALRRWFERFYRLKIFETLLDLLPDWYERLRNAHDAAADHWREIQYSEQPGTPRYEMARLIKESLEAMADQFDRLVDHPQESPKGDEIEELVDKADASLERLDETVAEDLRNLMEDLFEDVLQEDLEARLRSTNGLPPN